MTFLRALSEHERWQWFAAGETAGAAYPRSHPAGNEPERVLFEIGLIFALPLALAAFVTLMLGG